MGDLEDVRWVALGLWDEEREPRRVLEMILWCGTEEDLGE